MGQIPTHATTLQTKSEREAKRNYRWSADLFVSDASDCFDVKQLSCIVMDTTEHDQGNGMSITTENIDDILSSKVSFILNKYKPIEEHRIHISHFLLPLVIEQQSSPPQDHNRVVSIAN